MLCNLYDRTERYLSQSCTEALTHETRGVNTLVDTLALLTANFRIGTHIQHQHSVA